MLPSLALSVVVKLQSAGLDSPSLHRELQREKRCTSRAIERKQRHRDMAPHSQKDKQDQGVLGRLGLTAASESRPAGYRHRLQQQSFC